MRSKLFSNRGRPRRAINRRLVFCLSAASLPIFVPNIAAETSAPQWMRSLQNTSLPPYDARTDAVLLDSETEVVVLSTDKIKTHVREVYKILRPEGRVRGNVVVYFRSPAQRIVGLHGWCIPAQGQDFEVKEKDAVETAPPGVEGSELIADVRALVLRIPASDPGNIIGYEYEIEQHPFVLQDVWSFQQTVPARETRYSLQLPPGWEYKAFWINYPGVKQRDKGNNQWEWVLTDIKEIRREPEMPPLVGVSGQMVVSFFAAGGPSAKNGYADWRGMGVWYANLVADRVDPSEAIKQRVNELTASKNSVLEKMQAIAAFVQHDIRYVAIELGIGGWQPHYAADIFAHRYGDCKDKATLMRSMLREINIQSYHLVINNHRGSVTPETPAYHAFNHVILAIRLPDDLRDPSLIATIQDPILGRILFFDPTDAITPFGQIKGELQANYGLLVGPNGGELIQLPQQPSTMDGIQRIAKFALDPAGGLKGEVQETRLGDRAWSERWRLRSVTTDKDRIKPIETLLADSLTNFNITHASIINLQRNDLPFGFKYGFESITYAKNAGNLLLLRPRVLGIKSQDFLETKEPRKFPVEFEGPARDTDNFEITIPPGYTVDDVPDPVDAEYSFASYHSKTEIEGSLIRYTRTYEVKELAVPTDRAEDLKQFYRTVAKDERSTVVLKRVDQ
jgi:hypothetical protein